MRERGTGVQRKVTVEKGRQGIFTSSSYFGLAAYVISYFRVRLCVEEVNIARFPARERSRHVQMSHHLCFGLLTTWVSVPGSTP